MTPEREEYGPLTDRDELSRMRALVDSLRAELAAAKVEREAVAVNAIHECADLRKALENTRAALKQVTAELDRIKTESPTRGHSFVASVVRANSVTCVHCGFSCPAYGDLAPMPLCGPSADEESGDG